MNEIGRDAPLAPWSPHRRSVRARRAVVVAARGLLALAALTGGAAEAEPSTRQAATAAVAQTPAPALEREYLRCDRAASQYRLTMEAVAYCGAISEELLQREFDGDFDRLLAWWQMAKRAPLAE